MRLRAHAAATRLQYRSNAAETDEAKIRAMNERAVDFVKMHENIDLSLVRCCRRGARPRPLPGC